MADFICGFKEDSFRRLQIPGMAGIPGLPGFPGGIPGVGGGDPDSTNGGIGGLFSGPGHGGRYRKVMKGDHLINLNREMMPS